MNFDNEIRDAKRATQKESGAVDTFKGTLGATVGGVFKLYTDVLNQYYVTRSDTGGYESVFNHIAPPEPDLEVFCGKLYGHDYFEVASFDFQSLARLGRRIGAGPHHQQHEVRIKFGQADEPTVQQLGPDPVFLSNLQLTNLALAPHQGMVVKALSGAFEINGVPYWSEGGLLDDQTPEMPGSGMTKLCLVEEDNAGDFYYSYSAEFATTTNVPAILTNTPTRTSGRKARGLLLLVDGETALGWNRILPLASITADAAIPPAVMIGADGTDPGEEGLVPAPANTDNIKFLRGDATWAMPPAPVIVSQAVFHIPGTLSVGASPMRIYNNFGASKTITKVMIAAPTAPTGAAIKVDVNLGGTTIFTNQAHRPEIVASANTGTTTDIDVPTWAANNYLTIDIDQVGSTIAGADLTVHVVYQG